MVKATPTRTPGTGPTPWRATTSCSVRPTSVFDYTFSVDADGTVHLVAQPPINPGTAWVMATNPWTKID